MSTWCQYDFGMFCLQFIAISLQAGCHSWWWLQDRCSHPPDRLHCRKSWHRRCHCSHDVVPHVDALTAKADFGFGTLVKRLTGYVRFSDHGSLTIRIQVYEIMKFTNPHFKFLWEKTGGGLLYDFQDCLNLVKDGSRKDGSHVNVAR